MFTNSFWALLPPIIAILLALITKEVYSSLMIGIIAGGLLYAEFHPIVAMEDESAIFIKANAVWKLGKIHWIDKGGTTIFTDETLKTIGNTL